ncbi:MULTISPECIES: Holliday junction branch migration protein RuvA [Bacillaceae]|uniref:Holliday junction branch migration complex subunit RuvA n=2 Tax=Bacillus infantis TaxID=324767 RepID=U5LCQ6_9BACI|nr:MULTISPECIES: Holliday junction branch migration protein RuvA [Bacillus]AGX05659.1 Holliday junction DNA helicase RuvA [Bacillus infantis NRRL B-14911]EAR65525.1 Holliday junction DNA helicase motor protein [Bacillus sp. NRRL B-14911]MCA1036371.1 Holliday junction branch migration protein RuvA [Bacillus infantis]MCK6204948.1 Holliday junction branch migration protein RuvA [Bacillus infantis]MDT0161947.1 Holliday junction branch migration protein RuvA [Bacillus sp. AG4(2022)]
MFEYIKGTVEFIGPEYIVVENNGLGYQISTPNPFSYSNKQGGEIQIFTYHYVREDIFALYGFHSREEKMLFTKLLNVSGIGPKGALAILASGEPAQVVQAIEDEDEAFLVKFPGVGKKTARQMILDLKGKLQEAIPDFFPNLFNPDAARPAATGSAALLEEAILALRALGYSEKEVKRIKPALEKEKLTTDEYIKKGLQLLLK